MGKKVKTFEQQCIAINNQLKAEPKGETAKAIYRRTMGAYPVYRTWHRKPIHYCSECGGGFEWIGQKECPHCHVKFTDAPRQYQRREVMYHMELEAKGDIQLTRVYRAERWTQYGRKSSTDVWEVERFFYAPNGERRVFARSVQGLSPYYDAFSRWSPITIRREGRHMSWAAEMRYNLSMNTYHVRSLTQQWKYKNIPELMKEYDNDTSVLRVIAYPWAETLLKTGQEAMFRHMVCNREIMPNGTEHALKICSRHQYVIDDPTIWIDTIAMLKYLHMDTHNPKFICPEDLLALHQQLFERKCKVDERRAERARITYIENELKRKAEKDKNYAEMMQHWPAHFGNLLSLNLQSTNLDIRPLQSIDEFKQEGDTMHHCVYTMGYYDYNKRPNCLILSAKDGDGKRLATIEYNTKDFSIVQCRAACNQVPERDAEIRGLINSNTATIQKLVGESIRKSA